MTTNYIFRLDIHVRKYLNISEKDLFGNCTPFVYSGANILIKGFIQSIAILSTTDIVLIILASIKSTHSLI